MAEAPNLGPELQVEFRAGVAHLLGGRWGEAESVYRRIVASRPDLAEGQHNLGLALTSQGKTQEAIVAFRASLALRPNFAEAWNSLGDSLRRASQPTQALEAFETALRFRAAFPEAYNNLGVLLQGIGQLPRATEAFQRATALRPEFPEAWKNLGNALRQGGKAKEAVVAYRQVVALSPGSFDAWTGMGDALRECGQPAEALEAYRRSLALPESPQDSRGIKERGAVWFNLATTLKDTAQLDEALACYDRGLALQPECSTALGDRLYTLVFHPGYDNAAIYREARRWNDRFARPLPLEIPDHDNEAAPERRLRVGYVSSDFRRHVLSVFTMPLIANHDHNRFEVYCYSAVAAPDEVTPRFRRHADHWRDIRGQHDDAVALAIRRDRIDILVDFTLHMAGSRMTLFARKPAPIAVTWLGYPGTTGLDAIDYRITDPHLDPLDQAAVPSELAIGDKPVESLRAERKSEVPPVGTREPYYSERSVRLPETFWCYDPRGLEASEETLMPEPGPLPALAEGRFTFGCLNNFCKVTDRTLELWRGVMAALPTARLILLAPPGPHRSGVVEKLGVSDPERVQFVAFQPRRQYLETYHRIDLCLDTLAYNGQTTSLDALWMGVPLVTRVGGTASGRAGLSQLANLGLTDLVAWTDEEFVQKAVDWAGNLQRLSDLRATLRRRMEGSVLMDGPRFARNMEDAYRQMWRAWCASRS